MKRVCASLVLASLCVFGAFSQSNDFVDGLIESDSVSVGQAAYLVLVASDNLGDDADAERAFEMLGNFGWAPEGASADTPIRLKDYSYLLMSAFGLRGGLMYALFPGPRYAYRQLVSSFVIQGRSDPDMAVSGPAAVRMLGRVFDVKGIAE